MNRKCLFIAFIFLMGFILISAGGNVTLTVTVKEAQIRTKPSYLGAIVKRLQYKASVVQAGDPQKGWVKVTLPSGASPGWINLSAITEFKGKIDAGNTNVDQNASTGNIQAAGKGFTKEIEVEYKSEKHLDYTWVDRMERYRVTPEQASSFLNAGGLSDTLGGEE
jgi:hypothetical protein